MMTLRSAQFTAKALTFAALAFGIGACKELPSSEEGKLQTLDNFTRGDQALKNYQCGPHGNSNRVKLVHNQYGDRITSEASNGAELTAKAHRALAAAPDAMTELYFKRMNGHYHVEPDIGAYCRLNSSIDRTFASEDSGFGGTNATPFCFKTVNNELHLYVAAIPMPGDKGSADPHANIYHSTLRALAYFYSKPVIEGMLSDTDPQVRQAAQAFNEALTSLASRFLEIVRTNNLKLSPAIQSIARVDNKNFARMIFAETVDSLYCSRDSFVAAFGERAYAGANVAAQAAEPHTALFLPLLGLFDGDFYAAYGRPWHLPGR